MQRVYTKDNDKKGVAFNILFDRLDEDNQIAYPILSCAVAERTDGKPIVKCNGIISAGWEKDSHPLSANSETASNGLYGYNDYQLFLSVGQDLK